MSEHVHIMQGEVWRDRETGEPHCVTNVTNFGSNIWYVIGTRDEQKLASPQRLHRNAFLRTHVRDGQ